MSANKRPLSQQEAQYLHRLMEFNGCTQSYEDGTVLTCPLWSWDKKNEDTGQPGDCTVAYSDKLCVKVHLARDGDSVLELRKKELSDLHREKEELERTLLEQKRLLEAQKEELKNQDSQLNTQLKKVRNYADVRSEEQTE